MSEFLEPSYFEGGEPKSRVKPGDEHRELLHEIRNLNTGLGMLQHMFQQMLPVLEALGDLDTKLHHMEVTAQRTAQPAVTESGGTSDG